MPPGEPPFEPLPPQGLARPDALAWITLIGCLGLFLTAGLLSQVYDIGFGIWFTEIFLFLGLAWSLVRASGRSPWRYCRLEAPSPTQMLFGFALGTANYFAFVIPLQFIATSIAPKSWLIDAGKIFEQQSQFELTLVTIGVGVIAPVCEEFVFRGVFQQGLLAHLRPAAAIAIAATIFSAFHIDVVGFVARFELGCLFGILFYRYGSLWPGVFAHAANNLVPTAMFFALSGAANDQEPTVPEVLRLALFGIALFAVVLSATQVLPELRKKANPAPGPAEPEKAPGFLEAYLPWGIAALISTGLWVGGTKLIRHYRHHAKPAVTKQYRL